ncbi:hypothetical protein GCM10009557_61490 [Virgisporangium ochraceum]|uniref:Secreted protein n=1 Tax=Virgisporangium ochraceum TaxID=65505 RepID=A0A8J4EDE8_9ACTN|nr:DUF6289 family protein [Virgisporangium ochraceum]GIJ71440.1 hypothetical protein Voc01_063570 [Virgisporangium ochraceum]
MLTRGLLSAAFAVVLLTVGASPAAAIPPGDQLLVIDYYSSGDRETLIGQKWRGCPGQEPGQWGRTSTHMGFHTVPC